MVIPASRAAIAENASGPAGTRSQAERAGAQSSLSQDRLARRTLTGNSAKRPLSKYESTIIKKEFQIAQPEDKQLDVIGENADPYGLSKAAAKKPLNSTEAKRLWVIQQKNLVKQKYGRKQLGSQQPRKAYGILGLDPLVEEEGSSAYFAGKDLEKQSNGYSVRSLLPNLYSNYGRSKEDFEKLLHDRDREIKQNEKYIKKMEPVWRSEAT